MTGFLSQEDMEYLTELVRPADQRRWLDERGIPYWVSSKGRPKVLWSALEPRQAERSAAAPDWQHLP